MAKWKKGAKWKAKRRWRIKLLIRKYEGKCAFCDEPVTFEECSPNQATVDHILPKCKGGGENLENLQLLCRKCNLDKGETIINEDGEIDVLL